jgi:hypothetical protein
MYKLVDGVLVQTAGRAPAGAKCDCTNKFVKGPTTYCVPDGLADLAVCRKKP